MEAIACDHLKQLMVVSIVHLHSDDDWTRRIESPPHYRPDIVWRVDHQAGRAKRTLHQGEAPESRGFLAQAMALEAYLNGKTNILERILVRNLIQICYCIPATHHAH